MKLSSFGQKFTGESGILQLMDDLGQAASQPGVIMLGGGNPAHIPAVQAAFRDAMARILDSEHDFEDLISAYAAPQGDTAFTAALAALLQREYGWPIGPEHIALTNGSQTAFFLLFNLFAGRQPDGSFKRILLPLAPEYIGYADAGLEPDLFIAQPARIDILADHTFKYRIDFDNLTITPDIAAICLSRPTNPSGNVITDAELATLTDLARQHNMPLIVDNAYGLPFPGIIFTEAQPHWQPGVILSMSLSKLGLPALRTGILIADPDIIRAITALNAIISLTPGSFGPRLALDAIRTGSVLSLSRDVIRPYYHARAQHTVELLHTALPADSRWYIHQPEGAIFLWLWFPDLPLTCAEFYARLKARGVVLVPGHYFFPGLQSPWDHQHQCLRLNYAADPAKVERGIAILAEEYRRALAS